jgi:transglutaminase-like putative cysteine protease
LARVWRFVRDPSGIELITAPKRLLDEFRATGYISGDCDDAAILGSALAKAIGLPARFVVFGFLTTTAPFSHVYNEVWTGKFWMEYDVTRPPTKRPAPTRIKVVRV